jgi:hypothetical protein
VKARIIMKDFSVSGRYYLIETSLEEDIRLKSDYFSLITLKSIFIRKLSVFSVLLAIIR